MSLPRQLPPVEPDPKLLALFDLEERIPVAVRRQATFFVFFARTIFPLLESYRNRLSAAYCQDNGRPAWDPVRLLGVLIMQFVLRVADRQAAENVQYDQRWRLALHLGEHDVAFEPSVLVVFRNRLLESGQEALTFEAVLDYLVEHGWVAKRSRQRLDSTHVWGLLREMSRLECARETIGLFLKDVESVGLLPESWAVYWDRYVDNKLDPRAGKTVLQSKSAQAGEDMLAIWKDVTWPIASRDSFLLLQRVFLENYETDIERRVQVSHAQPTNAVKNPHEPEAQWSSKSTPKDKHWVGYKTQVAETVQKQPREAGEPTANFLTAIVTQDAPASDKAGMAQVLKEQRNMGMEAPSSFYVDGAYISGQALHDAKQEGRELHGPAPASPDRGKVFVVEAFDVHASERFAVCPEGQRSSNCSLVHENRTDKIRAIYRIEWSNTVCSSCPSFCKCVSDKQRHRTIVVGEHHDLLQARRNEMQTDAFKKDMQQRNGIEGTQSELVRGYGLRHARYRGKAKVRLQDYLIGAACNIRRLFRRIEWLTIQALKATETVNMAVPA